MTQHEKDKTMEALREYVGRYPSQSKAAASLKGISAATLSAMLNGKHDLISDEMWRNIGSQIGVRRDLGWFLVETRASREMSVAMEDAQEYRNVRWITGDAGCGKSTTAMMYAMEHSEVFTVLCDKHMSCSDFVREIARKVGLRNSGMRIRDMLNAVMERLVQMERPLLIFDEGDKLNDNVLHYFITLYNYLEGKCGMVFLSTSYIECRLKRGRGRKEGYDEVHSRIGRRFFELEPTSAVDVDMICRANGLTDGYRIRNVIKVAEGADFDLRCVKQAVHREIKVAQIQGKKRQTIND